MTLDDEPFKTADLPPDGPLFSIYSDFAWCYSQLVIDTSGLRSGRKVACFPTIRPYQE